MKRIDYMSCNKCGNMTYEIASTPEMDIFLIVCNNPKCRSSHKLLGKHVASFDKPPVIES